MKLFIKKTLTTLLVACLLISATPIIPNALEATSTVIDNLTVEYTENPIGLECDTPRFGWQMNNYSERGLQQTAYRIFVATSAQKLAAGDYAWDSGEVKSEDSVDIAYGGTALEACTRYYWTVKVWDNKGRSFTSAETAYFEMGLCNSGWDNAQWIQKNSTATTTGITTYTIDFDFIIDNANMGFAFGAKDSNNYFMWQVNSVDDKDQNAIYLRPHVKQNSTWTVLPDVSTGVAANITSAIGYNSDTIIGKTIHMQIAVDNGVVKTYFGGSSTPAHTYSYGSAIPLEKIAFRHHTDSNATEIARYDNFVIKDGTGAVLYENDFSDPNSTGFIGGTLEDGMLKVGQTIAGEVFVLQEAAVAAAGTSAPMLRKEFSLSSEVKSARIYATAAGLYDLYLNGQRVGDDYFNPGWTDYTKRLQYQTFDVTDYLKSGDNAIGAILGKGWYCGNIAHVGENRYGTEPALMARLVVTYADGSKTTIVTDSSWTCNTNGPITDNNFLDGEKYDATKEIDGWSTAEYVESSQWNSVKVTSASALQVAANPESQVGETVKAVAELTVKEVTEPKTNAYIYDFGQNFAGVVRLTLPAEFTTTHKGVTIKLRHGEMLNDASGTGDDVEGSLYDANLRTFKAIDTYKVKGDANGETFTPTFTYHGFRYVEITGLSEPLPAEHLTGIVLSNDLETTGNIKTDNELVNQLYSNAYWGLLSNFISVPTDCPQRNERMGWLGDAQIYTRTATYLKNSNMFYQKYLGDIRTSQLSNGAYTDVAPSIKVYDTAYLHNGWGDAGVIIPWQMYQQYGDTQVIRDNYDSMKAWVDLLFSTTGGTYIRSNTAGYGDWLSVETTNPDLTDTGFFIYSSELLSKMAKIIGKTSDADYYADMAAKAKAAWKNKFQNADGSLTEKTQTACIVALQFNIVEDEADRAVIAKQLVDNIKDHGYHLTVGFVGVSYICPVLSDMGYSDVAYALLQQETYPSWLYSVNQGATTIWERWNSYTKDGGFGPVSMNSFNHYSYGAIVEWMYRYMLGVERDEDNAGYKHFVLQPQLGGTINDVSGYFDTVYGRIESAWSLDEDNNRFTYSVSVPANTTATLYLPKPLDGSTVTEGGVPVAEADGVTYMGTTDDGCLIYELTSGSYDFGLTTDSSSIGGNVIPDGYVQPSLSSNLLISKDKVSSLWGNNGDPIFALTDATDGGITFKWNSNDTYSLRDGLIKTFSLSNLDLKFDNLKNTTGTAGGNFAILLTDNSANEDAIDCQQAVSSVCSIVLEVDTTDGVIRFANSGHSGKFMGFKNTEGDVILESEMLKYEKIAGKPFSITFAEGTDGAYDLRLTVDGALVTAKNALTAEMLASVSRIKNLDYLFVVLSDFGNSKGISLDYKMAGTESVAEVTEGLVVPSEANMAITNPWSGGMLARTELASGGMRFTFMDAVINVRQAVNIENKLDGTKLEFHNFNPFSMDNRKDAFALMFANTTTSKGKEFEAYNGMLAIAINAAEGKIVQFNGATESSINTTSKVLVTDSKLKNLAGKPFSITFRKAADGTYKIILRTSDFAVSADLETSLASAFDMESAAYVQITSANCYPDRNFCLDWTGAGTLEFMEGDANNDRNVDIRDLVHMKKYTSGISSVKGFDNADCNIDGYINTVDLVLLRKMLLGAN